MYIWYPVATGLRKYYVNIDLCHHYEISVDISPGETSLVVSSEVGCFSRLIQK